MGATHLEFLVEDPSLEAFLQTLLPRVLGANRTFRVHPFQGKQDLLNKLGARLRAYSRWLPEHWRLIVLIDRDDEDCRKLKATLEQEASDAGLLSRSRAGAGHWQVVNRLAIEELEAWYFGDWAAVRAAYPKVTGTIPAKARYRDHDGIAGGTWEAFERVLRRAGYFKGGLRKIEVARAVAEQMDPARNTSRSFCKLRDVLVEIAGA